MLEEGTPWANKVELYIRLLKEAIRKDIKDSNSPLAFWDYCVECHARINNMTAKRLFQVLGPTRGVGNKICQWILKENGNVVPHQTCRPLQVAEVHSDTERKKHEIFDAVIEKKL
eukprot:4606691-Ditylum_brightwellii.AAC.1